MLLERKTVHVPAQPEIDADIAEYGSVGLKSKIAYGLAATEAGCADFPDGEAIEAAQTGAIDAMVNVLLFASDAGADTDSILRSVVSHFDAERADGGGE